MVLDMTSSFPAEIWTAAARAFWRRPQGWARRRALANEECYVTLAGSALGLVDPLNALYTLPPGQGSFFPWFRMQARGSRWWVPRRSAVARRVLGWYDVRS